MSCSASVTNREIELVGVRHLQPDQPDTADGAQGADGLDGGAGLADARRPDHRDQPAVVDQAADGLEVLGPPDQGAGQGGQVADDQGRRRSGGGRGGVEGAALEQDLPLELAQRLPRLDAELVDEQPARPLDGGQRVGLPPGAVQGGDQGGPQALAQRVPAQQPFQLGDHLAAGAEVDLGGRPVLEQAEPDLVQARPVGMEPVAVAGVDQDLAPEQAERLAGRLQRRGRVTGAPRRRGGRGQAGDLEGVDPAGVELQGVAPVPAADQARVVEGPAQLGHLRLQGVPGRAGGGLAPQVIDQPLGRDEPPGVQRQPDQQLGGLAGRHRERPAVALDLQRAEHADSEHGSGYDAGRRRRQIVVSGSSAPRATVLVMDDDDTHHLVRRLIAGDAEASAQLRRLAGTASAPTVLVAAALVSQDGDELLARAAGTATTTRDRQLVAIAGAHLRQDSELLDALVRDHLADHPDSILAAWIATQHPRHD